MLYQVSAELGGFRKGDLVRVKDKWVKQVNSIYSVGSLAFVRVKGEPSSALLTQKIASYYVGVERLFGVIHGQRYFSVFFYKFNECLLYHIAV